MTSPPHPPQSGTIDDMPDHPQPPEPDEQQVLVAGDDGYAWVAASDPRASEVRPLVSVDHVGDASDNLLVCADALDGLRALAHEPDRAVVGQVRLAYIDPPFNTGAAFTHYDDDLARTVWLAMMRDRLGAIIDLLRDDGSIWVHLDDAEMAYCKVLLDELLGAQGFVAQIVWQKRTTRDNRKAFSSAHDYLLVYSPAGTDWKHARNRLPDTGAYANPDADARGPWRSVPMSAQAGHATASQFYPITTPTGVVHEPPPGRAWTYTAVRFAQILAEDRVYWPKGGDGRPRLKRFASESAGLVPSTLWLAEEVGTNDQAKRALAKLLPGELPFSTPKPEGLLARIVHIASDPGDLVLDCFGGSGTTAAVAHKMGRRWVMIERSSETIERCIVPRLVHVIEDTDPYGITDEVDWAGGGGFEQLVVGPSAHGA